MSGPADVPAPVGWCGRTYGRFLAVVALAVAALAAGGVAFSGGSMRSVMAALGAAGLASAISGIPLALTGGPPHAAVNRALVAMLVRMAAVAVLATLCLLFLELELRPFLVWLVIGYLALLAVDTAVSVRTFRSL